MHNADLLSNLKAFDDGKGGSDTYLGRQKDGYGNGHMIEQSTSKHAYKLSQLLYS